eukprot:658066-Rhodomonas_salina.2
MEDAKLAMHLFDLTLSTRKPSVYEGDLEQASLFKTQIVLKPFQIRAVQEKFPNRLLLKTGAGFGMQLKQLVEEKCGSSTKAAVAWYVEDYLVNAAPHLEIGLVDLETYPGGNVNFNLGVSVYFKTGDVGKKAMLAMYAAFATRSDLYNSGRLDYTRKGDEPFNDMRCEADLDKRGWMNDPIGYFQGMWVKNLTTSQHEVVVKRRTAAREAGLSVPIPAIGSSEERLPKVRDGL